MSLTMERGERMHDAIKENRGKVRCTSQRAALILALFFGMGESAASQTKDEPVSPFHLIIRYMVEQKTGGTPKSDSYKDEFKSICRKIGNGLKVGGGLYGYGFAKSYACFDGSKMVFSNGGDIKTSPWLLELNDTSAKVEFVLYYSFGEKEGERREIARTVLPPTENSIKILRKTSIMDLMLLDLIVQTPLMRSLDLVTEDQMFKAHARLGGGRKENMPPPPTTFKVVKVIVGPEGLLQPVMVGKAERKEESSGGSYQWRVKAGTALDRFNYYWVYDETERNATRNLVRKLLEQKLAPYGLAWGKAAAGFANAFAHGYIGARYGKSIMKGDPLYAKSAMTSMFLEWRGGPLEGARLYYDAAITTRVNRDGENYHISWNRPSLGWAFGYNLPGWLDRIDITPKIGRMHFDSRLPTASSFDPTITVPQSFVVKSATSLGLEVGLETHGFRNLTRLWGGCDFAGIGNADSETSYRGGLDTYLTLMDFDSSDLSLLLFALGERISLTRKVSGQNVSAAGTANQLKELSYNMGYVGAGLTISF